jgi:hypothetical protein
LDLLRLVYWGKLMTEKSVIVRGVYEAGRERVERGGGKSWCVYTRDTLFDLGVGREWQRGEVGDLGKWRTRVWGRIQDREERLWRRGMVGKTTLVRYQRIKVRLRRERFLRQAGWAVKRLVRLRGGVERLEVVRGRRFGVRREDRRCLVCDSGEVEDEGHFVGGCRALGRSRGEMWRGIEREVGGCRVAGLRSMTEEGRVDWLLGTDFDRGHWKWPALQSLVIAGLKGMWAERGRSGMRDVAGG